MSGAYEEDEDIGLIGRLGRKLPDWIAKPLGIPAFVAAMPEMAIKGGKADWKTNLEEGRRRLAAGEFVTPEEERDPLDVNVYPSATNTAFEDNTATQLADRFRDHPAEAFSHSHRSMGGHSRRAMAVQEAASSLDQSVS